MDAMEQAKAKGHDMGEFGPGSDPVWPLPQAVCRNCGLKLFQYEGTGNIYGAAALLSCQEMQKLNTYTAAARLLNSNSLLSEQRWLEWESLAEHANNWVALAKSPDRIKREQALAEYPVIFEEVKYVFILLVDMSAEVKRLMASLTELADSIIREG